MTAAVILNRLQAAGLSIRPDPAQPNAVKVGPPDRLTSELRELILKSKADILAELRTRAAEPTYTRCLDCNYYTAPLPDTAFWCPLVRGRPMVALWAICTGYEGRSGTMPEPTARQDAGGEHR